jgi:hypothetical protein
MIDFTACAVEATSLDGSSTALVNLMKSIETFEKSTWPMINEMKILAEEKGVASYTDLKTISHGITDTGINHQIQCTTTALGAIVAKVSGGEEI